MTGQDTTTAGTPPFFFCERGLVPGKQPRWSSFTLQAIYATLADLESGLEETDVIDGCYRAFDADGTVVDLVPIDPHGVRAIIPPEAERLPVDLEVILRRDIASRGDVDRARDPDATLAQLAQSFPVPEMRSGFRDRVEFAVSMLILLAIIATFVIGMWTVVSWATPDNDSRETCEQAPSCT